MMNCVVFLSITAHNYMDIRRVKFIVLVLIEYACVIFVYELSRFTRIMTCMQSLVVGIHSSFIWVVIGLKPVDLEGYIENRWIQLMVCFKLICESNKYDLNLTFKIINDNKIDA